MRQSRKPIHLARQTYMGRGPYFVTVCCAGRRPAFADRCSAEWAVSRLLSTAAAYRFRLHAWCVMPDHVHVLAEGTDDTCNLLLFVRQFKLKTSREWTGSQQPPLWQKNFYDHVLRRDEELPRVAAYIWTNPVRKGLCQDPREFSFCGSQTFPWKQIASPGEQWRPPWKTHASG